MVSDILCHFFYSLVFFAMGMSWRVELAQWMTGYEVFMLGIKNWRGITPTNIFGEGFQILGIWNYLSGLKEGR